VIAGPNKPKNIDSYLFPGFYHLTAIQKEGLMLWISSEDTLVTTNPYLALATADGPGMAYLNGFVGHSGRVGCRLACRQVGCHNPGGSHYYPAALKPVNYTVRGCDHDDVDPFEIRPTTFQEYIKSLCLVISCPTQTSYKKKQLLTGISQPTLLLGLPPCHNLGIPKCFGSNIMHLGSLNLPDLLISLWHGTIKLDKSDNKDTWDWAVLQNKVWEKHGKVVVNATPYLPGSFD
jgi:hypothetical protein